MSKITIALEAAVVAVIANTPAEGERATNRQRVHADRAFASILHLIAPRIRHFIRQYGLAAHWDDAEQACAIGVHRAIQAYDPAKAQFTTFVNWQIRGELQALRFRLMDDQRSSAKKVSATTISLNTLVSGADGDESTLDALIVDEDALERTEAAAAAYMTETTRVRLIDDYVDQLRRVGIEQLNRRARTRGLPKVTADAPRLRAQMYPVDPADLAQLEARIAAQRNVIERRLAGDDVAAPAAGKEDAERERARQVAKRATGAITRMVRAGQRYAPVVSAPTAAD